MKYLLGCLGGIIALAVGIAIIQAIFSNIVGVVGLALIIWAIYQWRTNRKLNVKSKVPMIFVAVGLLIMSIGFTTKSNEIAKEKEEARIAEEQAVAEEAKRLEEEQAAAEEAKRLEEEQAAAEEAKRLEEEKIESTSTPVESEWFQNCTELRTKYPSGVASDHPAYQSKMDRDKDGWACEK